MDRSTPNPVLSSPEFQFQLSLLRLMYSGGAVSAQIARLEQLREPVPVIPD